MTRQVDVAILGAGTAGLNAMAQAQRMRRSFVMFDGGTLGTTCARVGCMPSKVAIQIGEDVHRQIMFPIEGIHGSRLVVDDAAAMTRVRGLRDLFVSSLLDRVLPRLGDSLVRHRARFVGPTTLEANGEIWEAKAVVVATGSHPVVPGPWRATFGDRLLTTDDVFEQPTLPRTMAVLGMGVIGLELGQALQRLGVSVTGVDMLETVGGLQDPVVRDAMLPVLREEFPVWLGAAAELDLGPGEQITVRAGDHSTQVDKVLVALGRRPNVAGLNLEALGVQLDNRGLPPVDPATQQVGDLPVFFAGDSTGDRAILHEATHEGRVAGVNAAHWPEPPQRYQRKVPLAVVFSDPNLATVGEPWNRLADDPNLIMAQEDMRSQGRARVMGRNQGMFRLYADRRDGRLRGATLAGPHVEHLAHLLAWAIQDQQTVFDLLRKPFYHPTLEEGVEHLLNALAPQVDNPPAQPYSLLPEAP